MKSLSIVMLLTGGYLFSLLYNAITFPDEKLTGFSNSDKTAISSIKINRISFDTRNNKNEFGYKSGWIELVNNSDKSICLQADHWCISNDSYNPTLYVIRKDLFIYPNKSLIIWCDKLNAIQKDLHSNFALNSKSGSVGLYYIDSKESVKRIDLLNYIEQHKTENRLAQLETNSYGL